MKKIHRYARILAVDPFHKGFGFAVLEGERRLIDWGVARIWSKNDDEFLARVECLIHRYKPVWLVLQKPSDRRSDQAARRIGKLARYADQNSLEAIMVSKTDVREAFVQAGSTKREIAVGIAGMHRDLEPYLPPIRKPWMSESGQAQVFDAVGIAIAAIWRG